jgi:hypothetical protein
LWWSIGPVCGVAELGGPARTSTTAGEPGQGGGSA